MVGNITKLIDGLEAITAHLGLVAQQHAKLEEEIASLSDTQSLRLLQEVGSFHGANNVLRATSDTACVRLTLLTSSSSSSYHTAPTAQSHRSMYSSAGARRNRLDSALQRAVQTAQEKAQEGGTEPISHLEETSQQTSDPDHQRGSEKLESSDSDDIPQHQRWMAALTASKSVRPQQRPFLSDNSKFGTVLSPIRDEDEEICSPKLAGFITKTGVGSSQAQRIFIELRNIRRAAIPFISAAPVGDALDKILASVEGPPDTPYEGGIFWITVYLRNNEPPALRFHTRIYHPNIDHTGKLCADYYSWWKESKLLNKKGPEKQSLPWFSRLVTNQFNLGALLVAVCGLLADPNVDDPLVPEIAEKYITDYDGYHASAALYTSKYAHAERPNEDDLVFTDALEGGEETVNPANTSSENLVSHFTDALEGGEATANPVNTSSDNLVSHHPRKVSPDSPYNLEGPDGENWGFDSSSEISFNKINAWRVKQGLSTLDSWFSHGDNTFQPALSWTDGESNNEDDANPLADHRTIDNIVQQQPDQQRLQERSPRFQNTSQSDQYDQKDQRMRTGWFWQRFSWS